jgi:hypothetical protein
MTFWEVSRCAANHAYLVLAGELQLASGEEKRRKNHSYDRVWVGNGSTWFPTTKTPKRSSEYIDRDHQGVVTLACQEDSLDTVERLELEHAVRL